MHDVAPINPWVALAYLVAGVFFILALRGLSSPASSRRGNRFGMAGMAIAVVTTLVTHELANPIEVIGAIATAAAIGLVMARQTPVPALPPPVAAFHSLVGLSPAAVPAAAHLTPNSRKAH